MFHLLFKGNDLHSGNSPTLPLLTAEQQASVDKLISLTGPQNRVAYVSYPSTVASTRSASMSVSPPVGFWNLGAVVPHREANRHFTDPEVSFLGPAADRAQRFGVELALAVHNMAICSRLNWKTNIDDFLKDFSYVDEGGQEVGLLGFGEFHPTRDAEKIKQWLGYWKWHSHTASQYLIFITKKQLRAHRFLPVDTVISPALFGHHQMLDKPMSGSHTAMSVVEVVVGLTSTQHGVC